MDCTFALDCIRACPHDNVGIFTTMPGADLVHDPFRSGIGRFSERTDLAVMVLVLSFAAFLNAAEMIGPVLRLQDRLTAWLGLTSPIPFVTAETVLGLLVLPAITVTAAAAASRRLSGDSTGVLATARRYAHALAPLGFGMWLAHYSFHFFTSAGAVVPAMQAFARGLGLSGTGGPMGAACCAAGVGDWLLIVQILFSTWGCSAHFTRHTASPKTAGRAERQPCGRSAPGRR